VRRVALLDDGGFRWILFAVAVFEKSLDRFFVFQFNRLHGAHGSVLYLTGDIRLSL